MKEAHLVLLFDGTGLSAGRETPSNCKKIYDCLETAPRREDSVQHPIYYDGIGTSESLWISRALSQARGYGANETLLSAYHDVCDFASSHPHTPLKISICGFSRGFVIGLVLEKMIHKAGLLDFEKLAEQEGCAAFSDREKAAVIRQTYEDIYLSKKKPAHKKMEAFRTQNSQPVIPEFHLFAFDPVATFSAHKKYKPFRYVIDDIGEEHKLYGTKLPRGTKSYTEIIAMDEKRSTYQVLPLTFPEHYHITHDRILCAGDHSSIGGGCPIREPLADIAGLEMLEHMQEKADMHFDTKLVTERFKPDPYACAQEKDFLRGDFFFAVTRWVSRQIDRDIDVLQGGSNIHPSVRLREGAASAPIYEV